MSIFSRAILVALVILVALAGARLSAGTITPQIGGGIGQFDGGVASQGAAAPPPTCANDAPDGNIDLSKCSNAIYTAAGLL